MFWIIFFAILISCGCYLVWDWSNTSLFTPLGEVETCSGIEMCYGYDAMTVPARIVAFLCGVAAITIFVVTWCTVYGIIFVW